MGADGSLLFDTKINTKGFDSGIQKLGSLASGGLSILTKSIAGVTASVGAGVAASIKVGASFEAEMGKVSAISGAAGEDLNKLTKKAQEMGAKTKFSATESAQAMEYMAMAGWKTEEMLNGIEGIMNLAAASGEDLATTSDIVTDALTAFGLTAQDSTHFADVLAAASSNANTNVSMMGDTFKYVAPVAGALGFSAEDTAVAIGLMANSGVKASQAGTSLRAIISRLAKPTEEVQGAMDALGISLTDESGNMKSLNEIMGDLREGFSGLSESEAAQMAAAIGGQEAMSGLLAIVNASDSDFNNLTKAINNADGASERMAETMNNNLSGKITILKSSLEGLGIEIYNSIKGSLTGLADLGIDSIDQLSGAFKKDGISGLIDAGSEIVVNVISGIAQKAPTMADMGLQILQTLVSNLDNKLPELAESGAQIVETLAQGIIKLIPMLGGLAYSLLTMLLTSIAENAPQMIKSGTDTLVSFMQGITEKLPELIQLAIQAMLSFASGIVENLPTLIDAGIQMLMAIAQGIVDSLPMLIEQVPRIINDFFDALDTGIIKLLQAGWKIIKMLGQGIVENLPLIIENAGEIAKAILNVIMHLSLFKAGKNILETLGKGLKAFIEHPLQFVRELITKIKNIFSGGSWGDIGKNIINGIVNGIKNAAGGLVNAALDAISGAWNAMTGWLDIHSPSKKAEKVLGKNWALGIGVGFKKNMPVDSMVGDVNDAMNYMRSNVGIVESGTNIAGRTEANPDRGFYKGSTNESAEGFDYNRLQRIINSADNGKTIVLNVDGREFIRWLINENSGHSIRTGGDTIFG